MAEELFETFDSAGNPTGLVPRSRVHREGHWHRAANVFLFRSDGRLLLQRRRETKDVWPGAWDVSAAEHLKPGETYLQGALRGLREELGVENVTPEVLGGVLVSRVVDADAGVRDCEFQQAFRVVFDGAVSPDPDEVSETALYSLDELAREFVQRPRAFTPWFRRSAAQLGLLGEPGGRGTG